MVAVTSSEDRETFERDVFKPPHLARMLDISGEFTGRLDNQDRDYFLASTMDRFWEMRDRIKVTNDITRLWVVALEATAAGRPQWQVSISHYGVEVGKEWVKAAHLRRRA